MERPKTLTQPIPGRPPGRYQYAVEISWRVRKVSNEAVHF